MKHAAGWRTLSVVRSANPTDLTDDEWERIKPLLPKAPRRGRKPSVDLRTVLDAIRYMAQSGGGWRMLPNDFPPWQTVYWWFRRLMRRFLFRTIHNMALMLGRERAGREAAPRLPWSIANREGPGAGHEARIRRRQEDCRAQAPRRSEIRTGVCCWSA